MKLTGKIESYDGNNVIIKGKTYFIEPDNIKAATSNFPAGIIVTYTVEYGIIKGMRIPLENELRSYHA